MSVFYQLTPHQQSDILKQLAAKALRQWQIEADSIELVKYRENAVFKITTYSGEQFALRMHRPGYHSNAALRSELQWMDALNACGVRVPKVISTCDGRLLISEQIDAVPEPRQIDLFVWIQGHPLGSVEQGLGTDSARIADIYHAIGQTAARLHNQSCDWQHPDGFERHAWDYEGLVGEQPFWGRFWELEMLSTEQQTLLITARDQVRKELKTLDKSPRNYSLIHADFVPENLMTEGDNVRLIDFDDAGFGWHMFELATALYFIQEEESYPIAKQALIDGYRSARSLPDSELAHLELFLAARSFTYLGWIRSRQETETAQELASDLIRRACTQAERFLRLRLNYV